MLILPDPEPIDILELSDKAKVSPRTIRFYIQQGLLPAPETRGPGAHYGVEHVDRLRLIKRLQREHLPLSEIRKRIENLRPEEISRLLRAEPDRPPGSAADYVRSVLSKGVGSRVLRETEPMSVPPDMFTTEQNSHKPTQQRAQWERFTFSPDVELHVRRPVSREDNRKIERLLDAVRAIFKEELP